MSTMEITCILGNSRAKKGSKFMRSGFFKAHEAEAPAAHALARREAANLAASAVASRLACGESFDATQISI